MNKITIFPTERCNLSCQYCYKISLFEKNKQIYNDEDTFLEKIDALLEKYTGKINQIKISGGEPSLYKDLNLLIHKIKEYDIYSEICTNGNIINCSENTINKMDKIWLSLDSINKTTNDYLRNAKGSIPLFNKAVSYLSNLKKSISIQITVTKYNIEDLEETINDLYDRYGIQEIKISDVILYNNHKLYSVLSLSEDDLIKTTRLLNKIRRQRNYKIDLSTTFMHTNHILKFNNNLHHMDSYFMNSCGFIYNYWIENPLFLVGNILDSDFVESFESTHNRLLEYQSFIYNKIAKNKNGYINTAKYICNRENIDSFLRGTN